MLFFVYLVIAQSGLEPDNAKFFNEIISQILNQIAPPASKLCCISNFQDDEKGQKCFWFL